jgi:hypothetical protein
MQSGEDLVVVMAGILLKSSGTEMRLAYWAEQTNPRRSASVRVHRKCFNSLQIHGVK